MLPDSLSEPNIGFERERIGTKRAACKTRLPTSELHILYRETVLDAQSNIHERMYGKQGRSRPIQYTRRATCTEHEA